MSERIIDGIVQFHQWMEANADADTVALDLETSGFKYKTDRIAGVALATEFGNGIYIPTTHQVRRTVTAPFPGEVRQNCDLKVVLDTLRPWLEGKTIVIYNAKFDVRFLDWNGLHVDPNQVDDAMLMAFVAGEPYEVARRPNGKILGINLKDQVFYYFGYEMTDFMSLFPSRKKNNLDCSTLPINTVGEYAADDADYTFRLYDLLRSRGLRENLLYKLERGLWPIIREIEDNGFLVDRRYMVQKARSIKAAADRVEVKVQEIFANYNLGRVNLASPPALAIALYDKIGIPCKSKTEGGQRSTDEKALTFISTGAVDGKKWEIAQFILDWRQLMKAHSSVSKELSEFIEIDGRIYCSYNQVGAITGRCSSSAPNMQNINKKDEVAGEPLALRDIFIAAPDHYLLELDYKQIELVCFGEIAGETSIIKTYSSGGDLHNQTASKAYRISLESVEKKQRDKAKTLNYRIVYGGGAAGLAQTNTDFTLEEAKECFKAIRDGYPAMARYEDKSKADAKKNCYVRSYMGRKIYISRYAEVMIDEGIDSSDDFWYKWQKEHKWTKPNVWKKGKVLSDAERQVVNFYCQSTAAEFQKCGLLATMKASRQFGDKVKMVAQVHDSQTWEIHKSIPITEAISVLSPAMSNITVGIPRIDERGNELSGKHTRIFVDVKVGLRWGSLKDYENGITYEDLFTSKEEVDIRIKQIDASSYDEDSVFGIVTLFGGDAYEVLYNGEVIGSTDLTEKDFVLAVSG